MTMVFRLSRRLLDANSVLALFLVLCFIPSYLTITVVGSLGRPATLLTLAMFIWWLAEQLRRHRSMNRGFQLVRWALSCLILVVIASYAAAMFRGLPTAEVSPADTGLLRLAGWCGVCLLAHDGLRSLSDVLVLVRRVVLAGAFMALLGLAQFATKNTLLGWLIIPGMSGDSVGAVDQRAGFVRAASVATHPLEYGLVLCSTLPLALGLALEDRTRGVAARWWPAVAISAATVLSVSRSALISAVIAIGVLFFAWTPRRRLKAVLVGIVLLAMVYITVPGFTGTVMGMFAGAAGDSSVASRVSSYDVAFGMVSRLPILGRGFGTLLPTYVYLDNEYLGILIGLGLLGLATVIALFVSGMIAAWASAANARSPLQRQIGFAIAAAVCANSVSFTFFDALSFPLSSGFIFLMIGLAGAAKRVSYGQGPRSPLGTSTVPVVGDAQRLNSVAGEPRG